MTPRLKTSKKWTSIPKELTEQIQNLLEENFSKNLKNASLIVEGRIYPQEIMLRIGVLNKGEISQSNIEVSIDYSAEAKNIVPNIHTCVDAAASTLIDYFESLKKDDEESEFDIPLSWKSYQFQEKTVWLQFSRVNSQLEAEADKLLGIADDGILHEEDLDNDIEDFDTSEKDESEEDSEESGPRMFGKTPKKKSDMH